MPKMDHLVEFVSVVDAGSISAAARSLGMPRATLSRRLTALEQDLRVKLVHRDSRKLTLTHAGELLVDRARKLVASADEAWAAVRQAQEGPSGRLRLSLPPTVLFSDLLVAFRRSHPDVELQVVGTPRVLDLVAEGIDVALRSGPILADGLIARLLWSEQQSLVASPDYLAAHGRPTGVEQLGRHEFVVGFEEGWKPTLTMPLRAGGTVLVKSGFVCHDPLTHLVAVLESQGLALLPTRLTAPYVDSGQLERVLVDAVGMDKPTSLVFPDRELLPSQVRAFIDFTVAFYQDGPYAGGLRVHPRLLPGVVSSSEGGV
ncbi:MAG: LysR family transcriptional regulator [Myxococcota bacterium]